MNKKVLILGLSSIMLLASCGSNSTNLVLRKDVNFNPDSIVSGSNEIALIKEQVKQGFNLLKNIKVTDKYVYHNFDSANHEEIMTEENVSKVDFFSNGSIESSDKTIRHNNSVISKITTNNKEAIANDFIFTSTVGTDRVFPYFEKVSLSDTSKELALYATRRNYGNQYFGVDGFFPTTQGYHSIVARLNNTKIAAYNETKVVYVYNPTGSNEPTLFQIYSGYNYLEANLKGDSYIISKIETAFQSVGNVVFGDTEQNYIKLNGVHKLSESSVKFEYSYNNEQSNYKDSADLNNFVSTFPAWSTSAGTLSVSAFSPKKDETGKIIGVVPAYSPTTSYYIAHDDLHGFDAKLNGASPEYLYTFGVNANVVDYNSGDHYSTPTAPLNLTGGLTPTFIDGEGVSYYSLSALGKIYTFNVGLAYDAAAKTLTVSTFTIA